jgi:hypothetical protein
VSRTGLAATIGLALLAWAVGFALVWATVWTVTR